jgi:hypothetical protein
MMLLGLTSLSNNVDGDWGNQDVCVRSTIPIKVASRLDVTVDVSTNVPIKVPIKVPITVLIEVHIDNSIDDPIDIVVESDNEFDVDIKTDVNPPTSLSSQMQRHHPRCTAQS